MEWYYWIGITLLVLFFYLSWMYTEDAKYKLLSKQLFELEEIRQHLYTLEQFEKTKLNRE